MFLDPSGKPIFGGTYWPREDRILDGKPVSGFKTILARVVKLWAEDRVGLEKQAESLAQATTRVLGGTVLGRSIKEPGLEMVDKALAALEEGLIPNLVALAMRIGNSKAPSFPPRGRCFFGFMPYPANPVPIMPQNWSELSTRWVAEASTTWWGRFSPLYHRTNLDNSSF